MGTIDGNNAKLAALQARLDAIASHLRSVETTAINAGDVNGAIIRARDAQDDLNELFAIRSALGDVAERRLELDEQPTAQWLHQNGLDTVGRATLLESLVGMGDATQNTLTAKYSVSVSVTFSDDGSFESAKANENHEGMWDTIGAAGASYFGPPGWIAYAFVEFGKFVVEDQECQQKIDHQWDLLAAAERDLPTKLITSNEQLSLYQADYQGDTSDFAAAIKASKALEDVLLDRWKELLAYDVQRLTVSRAILTAAKIKLVQDQYGQGTQLDTIIDGLALTRVATDLDKVNNDMASRQASAISACDDVHGLATLEDQTDALETSGMINAAFGKQDGFAPLFPLFDELTGKDTAWSREITRRKGAIKHAKCNPKPKLAGSARGAQIAFRFKAAWVDAVAQAANETRVYKLLGIPARRGRKVACWRGRDADALALFTADGNVYACNAAGQKYDDGLADGGAGDGISASANDGGYAQDNARVAGSVAAATQNINDRISRLTNSEARASAALPTWSSRTSRPSVPCKPRSRPPRLRTAQNERPSTSATARWGSVSASDRSVPGRRPRIPRMSTASFSRVAPCK